MWKDCPYCHDYSFDEHALLNLSYYKVQPCSNCGKPVRNDGLRQLAIVPVMLCALVFGAFLIFILPGWLTPLGWLLLVLLGLAPLVILPKPIKADRHLLTPFDPDPENDKAILVTGWDSDELNTILAGFLGQEHSPAPHFTIEIDQLRDDRYQLTFPDDIHPAVFVSLINYLQYPIELPAPDTAIICVGRATVDKAFDGLPAELMGSRAYLYIPTEDQDCDAVFMRTECGMTFAWSLVDPVWRVESNPRLPLAANREMTPV